MDPRVSKLPQWAQREIAHLEMRIGEQARLIDHLADSPCVEYADLEDGVAYISHSGERGYRKIHPASRVLFPTDVGHIEVRAGSGGDVEISANGGWGDFQIRPHVSNVISVRAAKRD